MKIAIVTAYYEPIPAPRAFRAAELAREFVRRGYEVSVFNTTSVIRDGVNVSRATGGVKLVNLDIIRMQQDSPKAGNRTKEKWYKSEFRKYLFYFTTNTSSMRVSQYLKNPKASIYFYNKGITKYIGVMLKGKMEVLEDQESKNMIWQTGDTMYYKKGVTDPDYCVLKFTSESGRYYCNLSTENFEIEDR